MKHLIIIGAGGMGRCVYNLAINSVGYGTEFDIKGFLEYDSNSLNNFSGYPTILTDDDNYVIKDDDVFVCSIGDTNKRKEIYNKFVAKGGQCIFVFVKNILVTDIKTKL